MPTLPDLGRWLVWAGLGLASLGALIMLVGRISWFGRLPGDIRIERGGVSCFAPLATGLVISLLLTIILNVLARLLNK